MPSPFTRDQLSPAMQQRYGLDHRSVGRTVVVTALVVVFVGALAYVFVGMSRNQLDAHLVSWEVVGTDRVDLRIDVRRPADATVTCVLRAQDVDHVDVGYATLTIPPGTAEPVVDYSMRTLAPAYVTEILGCSADGAPRVQPPQFPAGVAAPPQPY